MDLVALLEKRAALQSTNDFNRYARHESHRARSLRKRHGEITKPQKGKAHQPPHQASSSELAVVLAERCWAEAREAVSALESAPKTSALRSRAAKKFAKAVKYAKLAASLDPDNMEIAVYTALVGLSRAVERRRWSEAATAGSDARLGLLALASTSNSAVYGDAIMVNVDPALRLAFAHTQPDRNLDVPRAAQLNVSSTMSSLVKKAAPSVLENEENSTSPVTKLGGAVQWRSHRAPVQDADLAQAILDAQTADKALSSGFDVATAERVLQSWQEALDAAIELDQSESSAIVRTYIRWHLLVRRIERDVLLSSQVADSARLYDAVLQTLSELSELPGVHSDEQLTLSLAVLRGYFQSKRYATLAESNGQTPLSSLALLKRASDVLVHDQVSLEDLPLSQEELTAWTDAVRTKLIRAHGLAVIDKAVKGPRPVPSYASSDLRQYPVNVSSPEGVLSKLADLNGTLRPVLVKPVFYDIALNQLEDVSGEAGEQERESSEGKKKGLFGFF